MREHNIIWFVGYFRFIYLFYQFLLSLPNYIIVVIKAFEELNQIYFIGKSFGFNISVIYDKLYNT